MSTIRNFASPRTRSRLDLSLVAFAVSVVAGAAVAGCSVGSSATGAPGSTPSPTPAIRIVTTTTVFADIVRNVGGDRVSVVSIVPPGVGPEDFEPKPEDARKLADATLIISNGVGLDDFLQRLLQSGTGGSTPQVVLGTGIPTIDIDGQPNPHFWLDPTLVATQYVPKITAKLSELDPAGATGYQVAAAAYMSRLTSLDSDLAAIVQTVPVESRKLVTFHDAYPYLARHYGFELVGVILANVGQEPTASELTAMVAKVKAANVRAVFSEAQFNPKLAQTLADEAGIRTVVTTLYNDALGDPPADTYLGMMRFDMEHIVAALR